MNLKLQTNGVKGHQNQKKMTTELKWEETLNIRADELTTQARNEITLKDWKEQFDFLPACNAHLTIDGKLITGKIMSVIRNK
eukprot:6662308-Ditylum_brightwellii.AAC.1